MQQLHTTQTGYSGGASPEEEAMTRLVKAMMDPGIAKPVLYCGWRAYATWLEILSGTKFLLDAKSADGRGAPEFLSKAQRTGRFHFTVSDETVNTRSGMAWRVEEKLVQIVRNESLDPDHIAICDIGVRQ